MLNNKKLRIARPSSNLAATEKFYCQGLGLLRLGSFDDHEGFDGIMLGHPQAPYHLEFTRHREQSVKPLPTVEDLLVFYLPDLEEWKMAVDRMEASGYKAVSSHNSYWDKHGKTFSDPDGYRVVLQHASWGI